MLSTLSPNEVLLYYPTVAKHTLRSLTYTLDVATGVAIAAFNTPDTLHSLTSTQRTETFFVLEHAKLDDRVRALIWTATGTRAFGAGANLKNFGNDQVGVAAEVVAAYAERGLSPDTTFVLANQVRAFWDFPKPLVVAVNGIAVGGAANIALMNFGDLVVCSTNARFKYAPRILFLMTSYD
jgi:enoyl-CoA hydratase/carnithine racemase